MPGGDIATLILWPIGFGLVGFIEPCAIGATLLFIKTTEGQAPAVKMGQVFAFTLSRALFIGSLGALAAFIGAIFLGVQKAVWLLMGALYAAIGVLYLTGRIGSLMLSIGPRLASLSSPRGSMFQPIEVKGPA